MVMNIHQLNNFNARTIWTQNKKQAIAAISLKDRYIQSACTSSFLFIITPANIGGAHYRGGISRNMNLN
jgi:hypothetical protein